MGNEVLKLQFNLFDEGRTYTGHHRNYILENAHDVCYAPACRERLSNRELVGFYGHRRRELAGRANIGETEVIQLPGGKSIIVENVPCSVTTFFEVKKDGIVEHHQELLLENEPGRIVSGLNKNKIGGFSWAMNGSDGGAHGATRMSSFEGFDYVINPGFTQNRGYVLESAAQDLLLESICSAGVDDAKAEGYLIGWLASAQNRLAELEEMLAQASIFESAMDEKLVDVNQTLINAQGQIKVMEEREALRRALVTESAGKLSKIVIPGQVAEAIISMATEEDFNTLIGFFENAARVSLGRYPLNSDADRKVQVRGNNASGDDKEYGRAGAAVDLDAPMNFNV